MTVIVIAIISALAAQVGGFLALKSRSQLNLTLGFTAGILIGLVAFDLIPEIFDGVNRTGVDILWPMIALVTGFLTFHFIEKSILIHHTHESHYPSHRHPHVGIASAGALIGHSFLDGISIALAFRVNSTLGTAVAIAVIGHRFVDGFNGINVMLLNKGKEVWARRVLAVVAVAPILGALSTYLFHVSEEWLIIYLGFFAGFMIYIGAADILPEAHSKGSSRKTIGLTALGAIFMLIITRLI